ncbi:thioredoxin-like protein CXXS1 isoform X1 [Medicago truncatula]|uniref:Thioredoxin n=1 Tax=Medicago truncatula TaxID=3880 RepID=A0A072V9Y4_MEDTR|nr:thioredoxin-like protein CXXS1 isoform X1 [Medicago truncatula]KEH38839.1 thioredoxin [Medicago truncatula]
MEGQEYLKKSKVIKIDSKKSWEHYISYATNQSYPLWSIGFVKITIPVVVVHFSAFWCVPSIQMNPFFQELASNYQDVLFLTLDVDEVKEIASKMEIKAIPTFLFLNGGTLVDKIVGANPDEIRKRVDHFIQSTPS